jgi:Tol biopolymer transport system component
VFAILLASAAFAVDVDVMEVAAVDGAHVQAPLWSNDGVKLAWEANYHERSSIELYVGNPVTRTFRRERGSVRATHGITAGFATSESATKVVHELTWGPVDSGMYVFAASNDDRDYDLFMSRGGSVAPAPGADGGPRWSPDGRWIVFTSARTGEGDLYLLDAHAIDSEPKRLTDNEKGSELYASWSPDGQQLLYVAHSATGDNVWLLPAVDGEARQLTSWPGSQVRPSFSPDSTQIAFYANHEEAERFDLYVMRLGATQDEAVLAAEGVVADSRGPAWVPDSKRLIVTVNDDQDYDPIMLVDATGETKPTPLALGTVGHGDIDLVNREDGLWIAFVAQGLEGGDPVRTFKRLFVAKLEL